jgi:heptaprenyl diphosphate synthase
MTDFWKASPALAERLELVVAEMDRAIGGGAFPLREVVAAAAEPSGKLIRPALLLIGSSFGKAADPARVERLAAAVELLHVATLIHDDIIDDAPLRRGRPSLHSSLGVKEAVLAGDWLFSRCFLLSSDSAEPENARGLARLIAAVCSAEIGQDLDKFRFPTSVRGYFRTIAGKTAALFSLSLHVGATEAKAGHKIAQTLRRAGYGMGMAFQVIDDILDFEAAQDVLRKPVGRDIAEGLCTLPLIYALRADRPGMEEILWRGGIRGELVTAEAAAEAAARAIELGGAEKARAAARRFTSRALGEIDRLPPSRARSDLGDLAERLLHRDY